ncbi:MAG: hypothetical protein IIU58_05860, partial [Clostridia bacterium]|nr:hypothetical protein [Clostridia bacterium]
MEKVKITLFERVKTILITCLTLTMLLLAGIYIGGAQFSGGSTAIRTADLPSGAVALGKDAPNHLPIYQKELLPVSFAGIRYGGEGGGTYGTEQAASALFDFAAAPIHASLGKGASLTEISADDYAAAFQGNFIFLDLLSPLPYQMLYALTGEYVAPAGSDTAINADRLLLVCADNEKILLYLSDGKRFYAANGNVSLKHAELSAMANDSRLFDFSVTPSGIAICAGSPHAAELTLLASAPDAAQYAGILTLLGYNPDAGIATVADSVSIQAVAPHGTLHISDTALTYTAARDSGIPISDFLEIAKSELDIDMYDILQASVSLAEQLRAIAPLAFGGEGKLHLRGFYREDDTFTVELGLYTAG